MRVPSRFNRLDTAKVVHVAKSLQETEPISWAEDQIEITTTPRDAQPAREPGKRFGVFFGVSKYEFNDVIEEVSGGKSSPNLPPTTVNDARRRPRS